MFSILPAFSACYFLFVGIFILKQNRNITLARVLFALCLNTFIWQLSWSILFQLKNYHTAYWLAKFGWTFVLFLPTNLYHFLVVLSGKNQELKRVYYSYGFSLLLLIALLFSNQLISGLYTYFWGYYPKAGPLHILHAIQTLIVVSRGLFITYQKQRMINIYRAKPLRYCITGLLICFFVSVDYLCNYGFEFCYPGTIFTIISLAIMSYAIVKYNLLDISVTLSIILSRIIIYSIFLIIFIAYNLLINEEYLPNNKLYVASGILVLVLICEAYGYIIITIRNLSESIIVRKKREKENIKDLVVRDLENSTSVDQIFKVVNDLISDKLKSELVGFYIKNELYNEKQAKDNGKEIINSYIDITNKNHKPIILESWFCRQQVKSRSFIEKDEYQLEFLKESSSKIFVPFINSKELFGFILVNSENLFRFWHYEIFNLLINQVGIIIDRINAYQEVTLQKQQHLEEKARAMKSIAGSIAHELRNPLNAINFATRQLPDIARKIDDRQTKEQIEQLDSLIINAVEQANNAINIILADLSEKPIVKSQFSFITASKILPDIISGFGYKDQFEKTKVKLVINRDDDFTFKAITDRFTFVIYNLIRNALYYVKEYPKSIITVGCEKNKVIDGQEWNAIYVHDTGPGIPKEILPKLFGDFYTSGKKEGTGLGLAFCKRNMQIFAGKIICESQYGGEINSGWTKFSLLFPVISEQEIEQAKIESQKKKILIVDDESTILKSTKARIENNMRQVSCDIALGGKSAIDMAKENNYQLILMDIKMPEIDGNQASQRIKKSQSETPIIAYTALDPDKFEQSNFDCYLSKSASNNLLYRGIGKWLTSIKDDLSYISHRENYEKIFSGKKIILADDQQINRLITKRVLENNGLIVSEASDGKELLELYKNSLDANGNSSFELILTDINMPPFNGDEAALKIRTIEKQNNIPHHEEIPIIALSGDGQKEDIHHFFKCQMTDYFIKGSDSEILLKVMAGYIT